VSSVESLPVGAQPPAPAPSLGRRAVLRLWGPTARRRLVVWCPPLFVALLFLPFLLKENSWWEWNNAFWFLERQSDYIKAHGVPTFFLHHSQGVFYPMPVYYGGFTFSVLGVPAIVLGAWPTFVAATAGAYVAGYFGIWWTARSLGLSRELSVLPALSFSCAPYMVATFYGRGAWAEVVGINAAAVVLGATAVLLWHPSRRRGWAIAALVPASAFVAGTHNLTLLMSAIFLPLTVAALLLARPEGIDRRELLRGGKWVVGGVLVGVGLTMAWLLPNVWFGRDTAIGGTFINQGMLENFAPFSAPKIVLFPWPHVPSNDLGFQYPQPSVLVGAWVLVATGVALWLRRAVDRRLAAVGALAVLAFALMLLICTTSWWPHFPNAVRAIQMPVRLVPYVCFAIAGAACAVIATLRAGRARQVLLVGLALIVAVEAAGAMTVALRTQSTSTIGLLAPKHGAVTPDSEPPSFSTKGLVAPVQFLVSNHPTATVNANRNVGIGLRDGVTSIDATMRERGRVGQRLLTAVAWSPYVKITGDARLIGRDVSGMAIIRIDRVDRNGYWKATVAPICSGLCLTSDAPWQLTVGRLITLLSVLIVLGVGGAWAFMRLKGAGAARRRRAAR
jgi:hypothetical protein